MLPLRLFARRAVAAVPRRFYSSSNPSSRLPSPFAPVAGLQQPSPASPLAPVPSTAHLQPTEIAVSRFFAQHRPLAFPSAKPEPEQTVTAIVLPRAFEAPPAPVPQNEWSGEYGEIEGEREGVWAISVKRQRKLKMKKHKYKKLMKRTRNLRRRIERQRN